MPRRSRPARRSRARSAGRPKRWVVYFLRCADGSLYTGITNDLEGRVRRHGRGRGAAYTRSRLPVALVYREPARDRSAALRTEIRWKRLTRAQKLKMCNRH